MQEARKDNEPSFVAEDWLPEGVVLNKLDQKSLPRIAKNQKLTDIIESRLGMVPSRHDLYIADSREADFLPDETIHLVITSPPYWTLKRYRDHEAQLGHVEDYNVFMSELEKVWRHCFRLLVPGGRLVCVVGDVCLSRRKNQGEHCVMPLHAGIQEQCRMIGFSNLSPVIWHKIANASFEVAGNGLGFLGKPYEPNSVIKNDIEFILMERKPGGYRSPSLATRVLSVIPEQRHREWFQQIWTGITGASTRNHPAPYPLELAERIVRMFSFVGDTVFDPFLGSGTTSIACAKWGRSSIGMEIDEQYFDYAVKNIEKETRKIFSGASLVEHRE